MKIPCCIFLHPFFAVDKHLGWRQTPWDDSTHEDRRCLCIYIYICINVYMSYCFANIACLVMILLIYQHSHGTCPIYGWFSH
jgi:hypothetical protein